MSIERQIKLGGLDSSLEFEQRWRADQVNQFYLKLNQKCERPAEASRLVQLLSSGGRFSPSVSRSALLYHTTSRGSGQLWQYHEGI